MLCKRCQGKNDQFLWTVFSLFSKFIKSNRLYQSVDSAASTRRASPERGERVNRVFDVPECCRFIALCGSLNCRGRSHTAQTCKAANHRWFFVDKRGKNSYNRTNHKAGKGGTPMDVTLRGSFFYFSYRFTGYAYRKAALCCTD